MYSVVIPVYEAETCVGRCVESWLAQTEKDLELILVDDGSSDRTLQIAEAYREAFAVRGYEYHIVRAGHRNASAAINHGLPYVTGEFLIWPDSDDRLEKDSVEKEQHFCAVIRSIRLCVLWHIILTLRQKRRCRRMKDGRSDQGISVLGYFGVQDLCVLWMLYVKDREVFRYLSRAMYTGIRRGTEFSDAVTFYVSSSLSDHSGKAVWCLCQRGQSFPDEADKKAGV